MSSEGTPDSDDLPQPAAPGEPTVLDVPKKPAPAPDESDPTREDASDASGARSAPTPSSTSGSGITRLGTQGLSGVTTAAPLILQAEEHTRVMALLRLSAAMGAACLIAIWLPQEGPPGRWLGFVTTTFTLLAALYLLYELKNPSRYDPRKILFFGISCVTSILAVVYYVGVFSPAIIAMYIGVYFFGLGDSERAGFTIYLSGALGYLALCVLALLGVIDIQHSVLPLKSGETWALIATTGVCQVLFATTFWMARRSRAATRSAFARLERAARQIKKRDALLDEARAELDRERAAKVGRFTDQQVGKYLIGEVIGRGAMGEVYRAWVQGEDRAVAVKFLSAALAGDPASVERFFREVEVARRVQSEHIVRVFDHGIAEGGAPFLVMELLEGHDLGEILREKKRLGMSETIDLVSQVAQALAAADEGGIVHRDLKPQNLFSASSGSGRVWKVLDFGVSKLLEAGRDLTMGAAVGTPSYMSPEQARGEVVDHRADVFALGVIAYRTLTGRPAFTAPDSASTLYNVVHVQPVRPGELLRTNVDVERALALALAKERERRLSSAPMFAAALREAARQRLDERLRRDADALIAEHPWGNDLLSTLRDGAKRWGASPRR